MFDLAVQYTALCVGWPTRRAQCVELVKSAWMLWATQNRTRVAACAVESRFGPNRGFGVTLGKLLIISKPNPYPKPEKPPARKAFTKLNLWNHLSRFDGIVLAWEHTDQIHLYAVCGEKIKPTKTKCGQYIYVCVFCLWSVRACYSYKQLNTEGHCGRVCPRSCPKSKPTKSTPTLSVGLEV